MLTNASLPHKPCQVMVPFVILNVLVYFAVLCTLALVLGRDTYKLRLSSISLVCLTSRLVMSPYLYSYPYITACPFTRRNIVVLVSSYSRHLANGAYTSSSRFSAHNRS